METIWFIIVSVMVAGYVVFDGFDLGVGVAHLFVAKTEDERRTVIASIGPVWDGNEVWLLAAGGILYFAFPPVYAAAFSGFYLPLTITLWLLIGRAISIEFRNQVEGDIWKPIWDTGFAVSSALLAVFLGAAFANVVRGVPLDADGIFFLPLWTDFQPGAAPGILDWYTILVGLAALATLLIHGLLWLILKTDGPVAARSAALFRRGWPVLVALIAAVTFATFQVQPHVPERMFGQPLALILPAVSIAALFAMRVYNHRAQSLQAFLSSCAFIVFLLLSAVYGLYPYLLPSNIDPAISLTAYNSATGDYGLRVGLLWFFPGVVLLAAYFTYVYGKFAGKVQLDETGH